MIGSSDLIKKMLSQILLWESILLAESNKFFYLHTLIREHFSSVIFALVCPIIVQQIFFLFLLNSPWYFAVQYKGISFQHAILDTINLYSGCHFASQKFKVSKKVKFAYWNEHFWHHKLNRPATFELFELWKHYLTFWTAHIRIIY